MVETVARAIDPVAFQEVWPGGVSKGKPMYPCALDEARQKARAAIEAMDINGLIRRLHDGLVAKEGINLTSLIFEDSENYERDLATITAALEG